MHPPFVEFGLTCCRLFPWRRRRHRGSRGTGWRRSRRSRAWRKKTEARISITFSTFSAFQFTVSTLFVYFQRRNFYFNVLEHQQKWDTCKRVKYSLPWNIEENRNTAEGWRDKVQDELLVTEQRRSELQRLEGEPEKYFFFSRGLPAPVESARIGAHANRPENTER
jgi:hypothetical protein